MADRIYNRMATITKSDSVDIVTPPQTRPLTDAVFVGGAGDLTVVLENYTVVTFTAVAAGTLLPIAVRRVNATGTAATNLTALWSA